MSRYELEWGLQPSRKTWTVTNVYGGSPGAAENATVRFELGTVQYKPSGGSTSPWATLSSYDTSEDKATGATTEATPRNFDLLHANCLICTVDPTGADPTTWVALQRANPDSYKSDWGLVKEWIVLASDTPGVNRSIPGGTTTLVSFSGTNIQLTIISGSTTTSTWGTKDSYDANSDAVEGKKGTTPIKIVRRVCVFCKFAGSGGNSWIAME